MPCLAHTHTHTRLASLVVLNMTPNALHSDFYYVSYATTKREGVKKNRIRLGRIQKDALHGVAVPQSFTSL